MRRACDLVLRLQTVHDGISEAIELLDAAESLLQQRLRRDHPTWSDAEIEREIDRWYATRPGAEWGDGEGTLGTWPR